MALRFNKTSLVTKFDCINITYKMTKPTLGRTLIMKTIKLIFVIFAALLLMNCGNKLEKEIAKTWYTSDGENIYTFFDMEAIDSLAKNYNYGSWGNYPTRGQYIYEMNWKLNTDTLSLFIPEITDDIKKYKIDISKNKETMNMIPLDTNRANIYLISDKRKAELAKEKNTEATIQKLKYALLGKWKVPEPLADHIKYIEFSENGFMQMFPTNPNDKIYKYRWRADRYENVYGFFVGDAYYCLINPNIDKDMWVYPADDPESPFEGTWIKIQ